MSAYSSVRSLEDALPSCDATARATAESWLECITALEDAGIAAVVLPSLFEEQLTLEAHDLDHHLYHGGESFAEALSYEVEDRGISVLSSR